MWVQILFNLVHLIQINIHITKWPSNDVIAVTGQKLNKGVAVKWAKQQENPAPNVAQLLKTQ